MIDHDFPPADDEDTGLPAALAFLIAFAVGFALVAVMVWP